MYLLTEVQYPDAAKAAQGIALDRVYPLSISEKRQSGEIFADRKENPRCYLFWHTCGFGFLAGTPDQAFLGEIAARMQNPPRTAHNGRLALEMENNPTLEAFFQAYPAIEKKEQYQFTFAETSSSANVSDTEIVPIDAENYKLLAGRITPPFSWDSEAQFLQNGFGFCMFHAGTFAACAFSAGISRDYVDIGVETAADFRGKGYGKRVVSRMIAEILRRGQTPLWQCSTQNEASMRLALATGFKLHGKHPLYVVSAP